MKTVKHWMIVPAALVMLLGSASVVRSQPIEVSPGFGPDPVVVNGTSGGSTASKGCGSIGAKPNHVLTLNANFNYLRINVQSEGGKPTLYIKGSKGSASCVPADSFSGGKIQAPGFWEKDTYSIFVGDLEGGQHPYTLSITQKP